MRYAPQERGNIRQSSDADIDETNRTMDNYRSDPHRPRDGNAAISILIVEDQEDDYILIRDLLWAVGQPYFHIEWSRTFESGLIALTTGSFDVCLLDYHLGTRNGLDLLRSLPSPQKNSTAILMLADEENPDIDNQAMQNGAMDYLSKSLLNPTVIERSIRHALTHRLHQLALQDYAFELEQKNQELAIARDDALVAIRLKAEFLSNMSHETRTPLNGILGLIHLLEDTGLTSEQLLSLGSIKDCTETLLTMLSNILDFSRIEKGHLDIQHIDFDIRATIEDVIARLAPQAHRKNLEIIRFIHATVPSLIQGDPGRLRQIINNLLSNAIKFSETGEINIQVTVESETEREVFITFSVTDNGVGIGPEQQHGIFAPFLQVDGSSKRKYPGAGLGLSVTKHLTELMGGTIGVESTIGQGSRFWVKIPFARRLPKREIPLASPFDARHFRAGLISADRANQSFLEHHCRSQGISLTTWPTAEQGLNTLQEASLHGTPFDVVIIDHSLTDLDGFTLAERIKANDILEHLPILLVTEGQRGEANSAQKLGIAAYLTKPFHAWQFHECLALIASSCSKDRTGSSSPSQTLITKHSLQDAKSREKARILLIEDNIVNQKVIIRALEKLGNQVDMVSSAHDAMTAIHTHPYDLILLDQWLSEFDQHARSSLEEGLRQSLTPTVLMTNSPPDIDETSLLTSSVVATISKPIKIEELAELISRWIFKKQPCEDDCQDFTAQATPRDEESVQSASVKEYDE